MTSRRLLAVGLVLGAGGATGCIFTTGGAGGNGSGGSATTSTTTAVTTATNGTTVTGSTTATTSTTTVATTTGTGGSCQALQDSNADCTSACGAIWDCGVQTCNGASKQLCTTFGGGGMGTGTVTRAAFIGDPAGNKCLQNCNMAGQAFLNLVDVTDCAATIQNLKNGGSAIGLYCP